MFILIPSGLLLGCLKWCKELRRKDSPLIPSFYFPIGLPYGPISHLGPFVAPLAPFGPIGAIFP